jgi:hypothetical protein
MNSRILLSAIAVAALSLLTACGGGDVPEDSAANAQTSGVAAGGHVSGQALAIGSGTTTSYVGGIGGSGAPVPQVGGIGGSGIASVRTARACALASVNVTIAGVRVNADAAAGPDAAGWVELPVAAPVRVDLLRVAAGQALPMDFAMLPDGTYGQIRLLLVADDATAPLADSVVAAGQETPLPVPSAAQGGLPLASTVTVAHGQGSLSLNGMDVCRAVSGAAGSYVLDAVTSDATASASAH